MRYFSIIRANENQGIPPKALLDAMDVYVAKTAPSSRRAAWRRAPQASASASRAAASR
jgi:hypothetical protein